VTIAAFTIADSVTLVIALSGFALSLYNTIRQMVRDERADRLDIRVVALFSSARADDAVVPTPAVMIRAVNVGHRKVEVTDLGMLDETGEALITPQLDVTEPGVNRPPKLLEAGESVSVWISADGLRYELWTAALRAGDTTRRPGYAYAADSFGNEYRGILFYELVSRLEVTPDKPWPGVEPRLDWPPDP
jgi:hypothetical protein